VLFLFSGKIKFSNKKEQVEQPIQVQKEITNEDLHYPKSGRPDYAGPTKKTGGGNNASLDQERMDAANAPIAAFGHTGGGGSGVAPASTAERPAPGSADALEASLTPSTMEGTKISELPDPTWLIAAGRILPCNQQTRAGSTYAGAVTALIGEDIKGETGNVVLLDKGAKIFGTIKGAMMNGADRMSVLWQHIDTPILYDDRGMPHFYRITTNSPAADDLGETGMEADVNRHLGIKIGGILGYSFIQTASQYAIAKAQSQGNGTSVNLSSFNQGTNSAADELLRAWVEIPDIATRDQALHCSLQLVRDLDMRAYHLAPTPLQPTRYRTNR
jgi:type IV secretion system protein VirB10